MANFISVENIVQVNINIIPGDVSVTSRDVLFLGNDNGQSTAEPTLTFTSATEVGAFFGVDSEEAIFATTFFSQSPTPNQLKIGNRYLSAESAVLRGGAVIAELGDFTGISDGSFKIAIDDVAQDITGLDFTSDTSLNDIAATIEAALQAVASGGYTAATVVHDGSRFIITSGTTGVASTIIVVTEVGNGTYIGGLTQLEAPEANAFNGVDAETVTEALTRINTLDPLWRYLGVDRAIRENAEAREALDFCNAQSNKIHVFESNDPNSHDAVSTSDIIFYNVENNYQQSWGIFSEVPQQYVSAAILGFCSVRQFIGAINQDGVGVRPLIGVSPSRLTQTQVNNIQAKQGNIYNAIGSATTSRVLEVGTGLVTVFLDSIQVAIEAKETVQEILFNFKSSTKVPFTSAGIASIHSVLEDTLNSFAAEGLLAVGGVFSDGVTFPNGHRVFTPLVSEVPGVDRAIRKLTNAGFDMILAGQIYVSVYNANVQTVSQ